MTFPLAGTVLGDTVLRASIWLADATPTPTPAPAYVGNEDLISPTWIGFTATFLVALATVFLLVDMNRRVRRTRYREEIREKLEAEAAEGRTGAEKSSETSAQ